MTVAGRGGVVVIGAGIVGLATAVALQQRLPGVPVSVLEKEDGPALHQTGRNSGVLHSGIYYRPGSLKARLCLDGRRSMIEFAREHEIDHEICGKLVVATEPRELERLEALARRGEEHGLTIRRLGPSDARELEPHVEALAAVHVAETGITDYTAVAARLASLVTEHGGSVHFGSPVERIVRGRSVEVVTRSRTLVATAVVNCAGLHSDRVAQAAGDPTRSRIIPFRGEYFELRPERHHLVRNLVYPVPDPDLPFLGVHLTRSIHGGVHAGPNAVLALAREGYRWRDIDVVELARLCRYPGTWRLARRHYRTGISEVARSLSRRRFLDSLRRLVPELTSDDLVSAPSGVRAQAVRHDGTLVDDFEIVAQDRIVHVVNAPSPAATSALAIGRHVAAMVEHD